MKRTTGFLLLILCCLLCDHLLKHASKDALTTAAVLQSGHLIGKPVDSIAGETSVLQFTPTGERVVMLPVPIYDRQFTALDEEQCHERSIHPIENQSGITAKTLNLRRT